QEDSMTTAKARVAADRDTMARAKRSQAASDVRSTIVEIEVMSAMDDFERKAIEATLDYTSGDKTKAARLLNIGRKTIYRKLDQYNGRSTPVDSANNSELDS